MPGVAAEEKFPDRLQRLFGKGGLRENWGGVAAQHQKNYPCASFVITVSMSVEIYMDHSQKSSLA
jgi:hypothetical protein